MRLTFRRILRNETARLAHEEDGVAVVFTLCSFLFLFACCTSAWFVGENVRRKVELQNACDAAAYSAAVVQADGLSRMAVVNRAMSWSYVQMTKMQMDYITLRWLELTKRRFESDRRNTQRTNGYGSRDPAGIGEALAKMFGNRAAYWTLADLWKAVGGDKIGRFIDFPPFLVVMGGFDCHEGTHDTPGDPTGNGSYIGFRSMTGNGNHIGCVRLNHPAKDLDANEPYVPVSRKDGGESSIDGFLGELHEVYGRGGNVLALQIKAMKAAIVTCNALLPSINRKMASSIEKTAVRTLFENLPRNPDGTVDRRMLDGCRWTVLGGASRPPEDYSSGLGGLGNVSPQMFLAPKPYFSALRNTEEDELLFLNMADGLPKRFGGGKMHDVRLVDYFADRDEWSYLSASTHGLASGLDQWFIRCDPEESAESDEVIVNRNFDKLRGGIVRAYKNANYDEGSSGASLLQKALAGFGSGVHRGNYVCDFLGEDAASDFRSKVFSPLLKVANGAKPSSFIHPVKPHRKKHKPITLKYLKKKAKYKAMKKAKTIVGNLFDEPAQAVMKPMAGLLRKASNLASGFLSTLSSLDVEPSCNNDRMRFVDKCANVRDTTGLVSEWEWASAYWGCHWLSIHIHIWIVNYDYEYCAHPFVPMAAMHGGTEGKGDATDAYVEKWGNEWWCTPFQWVFPEIAVFRGDLGKKRSGKIDENGYRSSFVSLDGDIPKPCKAADHRGYSPVGWTYGGKRSNYLFKGFSRVYGDDAEIYDSNYRGVPAQPWVLNEEFFKGAGSIVVGVARKQTNFFADLFDEEDRKKDILDRRSIFSAFTPADDRQHFVALSAARAAWSPRTGVGLADGEDSVNARRDSPRRYEVRYDSVLDRRLGPNGRPSLPVDVPGLSESDRSLLEQTGRIGCVCGTPNTTARLRRQWNLSQTDWDGVLLPLRHALAAHDLWDSGSEIAGSAGRTTDEDALSDWKFSFLGDRTDASATAASLLWDHAVWRPFSAKAGWIEDDPPMLGDESSFRTKDVLPLPVGVDDKTPADLIRKRRIL